MAKPYEIVKDDLGTYSGGCTEPRCEFMSFGWAKKKDATARMEQHLTEHATGEPMPELVDFMAPEGFDPGVPRTDQPETVVDDSETE